MEITHIKQGLLSKHLFQRAQQNGGCRKPLGDAKFVQKLMLFSYPIELKHSLKQFVPI